MGSAPRVVRSAVGPQPRPFLGLVGPSFPKPCVAGSNPVSPTLENPFEFRISWSATGRICCSPTSLYPNAYPNPARSTQTLPPQHILHRGCRLQLHAREDVAVFIKRDGHRGMPKHLANDFGIDAFHEQQRCGCVSEIVKADAGDTCFAHYGPEVAALYVVRTQRSASRVSEDEVMILPGSAKAQPLFELSCAMLTQDHYGRGSQCNPAPTSPCLWFS